MNLSQNKTIKTLNFISTLVLVFYSIFLIIKLFSSGAPRLSKSIKEYEVYDLIAKPKNLKSARTLDTWFNSKTIVEPTHTALVAMRFKSYAELFSLPAVLFQLSQLIYWLSIGYLLLCVKRLFMSFSMDSVFTVRNTSLIMSGAVVLLFLPIFRWITKELFINCMIKLNLNDSNYDIQNLTKLIGTETLIGLALLAFGLAFKAGVDLKNENETFI
ncbi:DUF2975 domain-containing protein [Pedobacter metabolipauper]|nr:DUF2975 domain-containing protein [Pedobacter metabolipauper]